MEAELYKQNPWWEGRFSPESIPRETYTDRIMQNIDNEEIIFLTGLRRIGKTTILKQVVKLLLEDTEPENILFCNLDTFKFLDKTIHDIVSLYRRIHKKKSDDFFYLILDEVTSKKDFEKELKSLYDIENIKIICSSSIATFMRDKGALLTGRTKTIEVLPLTFSKFLEFKEVQFKKSDKELLESYFRDYLKIGGIPKYVLCEDEEYLNELVETIIYKDIIAHYNIKNERIVQEMFKLLCERVGKPMSYSKIGRILGVSIDSVKRYISYFEKAYLFYTITRAAPSLNESMASPKKIYVGDVGIKNMVTGFRDLGSSYENLVFLTLKDKQPQYYRENRTEIDFVTKDLAVEAKYNRELKGKQKKVFDGLEKKKKIVAKSSKYFLN